MTMREQAEQAFAFYLTKRDYKPALIGWAVEVLCAGGGGEATTLLAGADHEDEASVLALFRKAAEEQGILLAGDRETFARVKGSQMRVTLLSTDGPWLEASLATPYGIFCVMDEFSIVEGRAPTIGEEFEAEFSSVVDEDESWEEMFSGNPGREKKLQWIEGWSYKAFGEVVSVNPVEVDCGMICVPGVFHSTDPRVVGEFVAFTISRLCAT